MNRRIFYGVVVTWFLLEGGRSVWKQWAGMRAGRSGFLGAVARDVQEVTS